MPNVARMTSMWVGICCCHHDPTCISMTGKVITGAPTHVSAGLSVARMTDLVIGACGHIGKIVTGSPTHGSAGLSVATTGSQVTGCTIGKIVTGSPTHTTG